LSVEIYGILPNLFDATVQDFVITDEYQGIVSKSDTSARDGLTIAEQLYTPRGSQGAGIS